MLRTDQLAFSMQGRLLLAPLSVSFQPGRLHAIFGPNGAGKSTLLRLLSREWGTARGQILLDDRPLSDWAAADLARHRAILPQQHALTFAFSAAEVVALGRLHAERRTATRERQIVADALAACGAGTLAARSYARLSGGERARVQLARVLAQIWEAPAGRARYLMLDEPTAHLDLAFQHACLRLARDWLQAGVCVIAVLHDPNLVLAYADDVLVLDHGRLRAQGSPSSVLNAELMQEIYGLGAERLQTPDGQHWLAVRANRAATP
ncbi:heme ABC transporter ATP-binding protein [Solimonas terrae]|uniref:Heme ABC transporter ATP-binding protein n=1 Tax=Solimonas terrae TaxID=1396819 RepID=A0A6M2BM11_9GAMM|nr:heme ABC transporter ATP-binding protein [Solimonas terrae]NGY03468.1 heme ABC transporter ATP-binding protein [Solimonas terrae]